MQPKVSIIVAAYNEEKLLPLCLKALQSQSYPKDRYEIIVVDNGSSDTTAHIAKEYGTKVFSYTKIQGCGASRAFGAKHATGELLAFTDADVEAPRDWLEKIVKALEKPEVVCVSGRPVLKKGGIGTTSIITFYHLFHILNHALGKGLVWGFTMAMKKDAYDAVGGIDETLLSAEDWDIAFKFQKKFGKKSVRYVPDIYVYTSARKESDPKAYSQYALDGVYNYVNVALLGKKKVKPVFNIR